ncbi:MAG: thymidine phosphorylase [Bacillota bacterium]|nr:thymidine phosphorylase [Bacillota bacterium]
MLFVPELIEKKKRGGRLTGEEIERLIEGYTAGRIPDYQIAALLMAIYFQGLDEEETTQLTMAMAQSGELVDLSGVQGGTVDKHSSGGIADTTTLVLLPLVAAGGAKMAKMSGRGLGHTGGTIDKLEAIPGFRTQLAKDEFLAAVNEVGAAITGQSENLVPADKKLYALRDVTATVDSLPLIASSIMSKKIAGGAEKIVLDVKFGRGAFMKDYDQAIELGRLMVDIGRRAGREVVAYVTAMDQPLGLAIGNSLEIIEAAETLKGRGHRDLEELCLEFGAELLYLAGVEGERNRARERLAVKLRSGEAAAKMKEIIARQGGNPAVIDDYSLLPQAEFRQEIRAEVDGYIKDIDALRLGRTALKLGAGRETKEDQIDLAVGIRLHGKVGDYFQRGEPLATVLANDQEKLTWAAAEVEAALVLTPERVEKPKVIYARITRAGVEER